jgi:hypothetical protein
VEKLAAASNIPISEMVRRLVQVVTAPPIHPDDLAPITRQASGLLSPMTNEEAKQALDEHRIHKYGGR